MNKKNAVTKNKKKTTKKKTQTLKRRLQEKYEYEEEEKEETDDDDDDSDGGGLKAQPEYDVQENKWSNNNNVKMVGHFCARFQPYELLLNKLEGELINVLFLVLMRLVIKYWHE